MTRVDAVVVLVVLVVLGALALPYFTSAGCAYPQEMEMLHNMKELHLASEQESLDRSMAADGKPDPGWPGDMSGSFTNWAYGLVKGGYMSTNDLCRALALRGAGAITNKLPGANTNAVLVYAVKYDDAANTVFLTSANFTNGPNGGEPSGDLRLFSRKGFVYLKKGGEGAWVLEVEAKTNYLVGGFVPLCR